MPDATSHILMEGEQAGGRYRLLARGRAPLGTIGSQLAHAAGESMEFMEHRDYQPGDDLRRMNWSAFARSDKLVVKVFRQEVSPQLDLVLDGSGSMNLPESEKLKATVALAAALACAGDNAGFRKRVYLTRAGCEPVLRSEQRPQLWEGLRFDSEQTPAQAFQTQPPMWKPHGVRVFLSDLLWMGNPMEVLNHLADGSAATYVIQVLGKGDLEPPEIGNHRLVDSETNEAFEVFIDAAGQQLYRRNLERHQQAWRDAARQVGAVMLTLIAEDLCKDWNLSALVQAELLAVT